jgi:hypothetical protein
MRKRFSATRCHQITQRSAPRTWTALAPASLRLLVMRHDATHQQEIVRLKVDIAEE